MQNIDNKNAFSEDEKKGLYRAIFERRDVREEFLPQKIAKQVLMKILKAAHHAGSVGFMQPWNFIVIEDENIKKKVKENFHSANDDAKEKFDGDKKDLYESLKLEGIQEAPINICITCDSTRGGEVLGRNTIKDTDVYSTCCAIQNLWLAARAEGVGVGWVSILHNSLLKKILNIPEHIKPVAYLCLGYVSEFKTEPVLETKGWRERIDVNRLISWNGWGDSHE